MINLDRVQECRPLHLTHPTPRHGPFSRRRRQSAPGLPSARKIATWRLRAVTRVTVGNMSNCRFGRCDAFFRCEAGRRQSCPCSARHSGITRHLHFTAGACPPELFARGLCRLGPSDPRSGETASTHDRGQTGVLDQWWNWLRKAHTRVTSRQRVSLPTGVRSGAPQRAEQAADLVSRPEQGRCADCAGCALLVASYGPRAVGGCGVTERSGLRPRCCIPP
jgi:hypothetical protein